MAYLRTVFCAILAITGVTHAALNGPCSANGTPGVCISIATCSGGGGTSRPNFCPSDPAGVQCCIKPSCGTGGNCRFASQCAGTTLSNLCPGPADFKCCVGSTPQPPSGGSKRLSQKGVQFIATFESFVPNFYTDQAGVKTIGYGHACQSPADGCDSIRPPITEAAGRALLLQDIAEFETCVNSNVKVALTQNQYDALVSFAFNTGCTALRRIAEFLNVNNFSGATAKMKEFRNAGGRVSNGLVRRRNEEVALFNS